MVGEVSCLAAQMLSVNTLSCQSYTTINLSDKHKSLPVISFFPPIFSHPPKIYSHLLLTLSRYESDNLRKKRKKKRKNNETFNINYIYKTLIFLLFLCN